MKNDVGNPRTGRPFFVMKHTSTPESYCSGFVLFAQRTQDPSLSRPAFTMAEKDRPAHNLCVCVWMRFFPDFPRFLGESGSDLIHPLKFCADLKKKTQIHDGALQGSVDKDRGRESWT